MADDSKHMIKRGKKAFIAAKEKMNAILNEVNNVRQSLRYLKKDAENFHEKCNVARTVGTTSSVVGAGLTIVGCVGAFFTGGASLLLTVGALGTTAAGAGVNLTTDVIDRKETKEYIKTITSKVSGLQRRFNELEAEMKEVQKTIERIMEKYGLDENEAFHLFKKVIKLDDQVTAVSVLMGKGVAAFKAARDLSQITNAVKSVGTITKTATGGVSYAITKPLSQLTEAELQAIRSYAPIAKGAVSVTGKVIQGTFIVISAGVVVWDIVSLVKDWNSTHPAAQAIVDVFDKLNLLERNIREKLSIMENIE